MNCRKKWEFMFSWREIRWLPTTVIGLCMVVLAGCNEGPEKASGPGKETPAGKTVSPAELHAMPTVTLKGTKIHENAVESAVRVEITASGAFGSNIIRKTDPERIIVILHNATKGEAPPGIEVNDGIINRVGIDQLNVGTGTAVRITIGLEHKADHVVTPARNGLIIDVRKRT